MCVCYKLLNHWKSSAVCFFYVYFFVPSLLFNAVTPIYIYYLIQDLITSCPECRHWTKKIVYFQCDNFCMLFHSNQTIVVLFTLIWVWTQAKLFETLKWERERLNFIYYTLPYLEVNKREDGCLMVWVEIIKWKIKFKHTSTQIHTHRRNFISSFFAHEFLGLATHNDIWSFFYDIFRNDYVQNGRIFCVLCCWIGKTLFNEALNLLHKYVKVAIDKMENKFKYVFFLYWNFYSRMGRSVNYDVPNTLHS